MNKLLLFFFIAMVFVAGFYFFIQRSTEKIAAKDLNQYCGSCHLTPAPQSLTKRIWEENVLPEMGARLGMKTDGYNPYKNLSFEEQYEIVRHGIYPSRPLLSEQKWNNLKKFIIDNAPKDLEVDETRMERNLPLEQFKPEIMALDEKPGSFITSITQTPGRSELNIGDAYGNIFRGENPVFPRVGAITSPVVSIIKRDSFDLVTGIGKMPPTEQKSGKLFQLKKNGVARLLIDTLHRPVFTELYDLNNNGTEEIIICEYGDKIGQLTLFRQTCKNENFVPEVLMTIPGTLRVIVEDMDNDNKMDLVVLHAQGDEGITIFYQKDDLKFQAERVVRLSPVYGSSWFELFDYDGDGDKDIAIANGDNADLSFIQKPYHGLRLFLNKENRFTEEFFYPIYGATRVVANDFDADGDIDFAVCSFFPDYENNPEESFIYLENIDSEQFHFKSYTFEEATSGRWMIMEQGDMDGDGDIDLMLGSFMHSPAPTPQKFTDEWKKENVDLIFLENRLF